MQETATPRLPSGRFRSCCLAHLGRKGDGDTGQRKEETRQPSLWATLPDPAPTPTERQRLSPWSPRRDLRDGDTEVECSAEGRTVSRDRSWGWDPATAPCYLSDWPKVTATHGRKGVHSLPSLLHSPQRPPGQGGGASETLPGAEQLGSPLPTGRPGDLAWPSSHISPFGLCLSPQSLCPQRLESQPRTVPALCHGVCLHRF